MKIGKKYFNRLHHVILCFTEEDEEYLYFIDICDVKYKYKKGFIEEFLEEYN